MLVGCSEISVFLLNMCNMLELSGLFVCPGGLNKFFSAWKEGGGQKKMPSCGLLGWISNQGDTMNRKFEFFQ